MYNNKCIIFCVIVYRFDVNTKRKRKLVLGFVMFQIEVSSYKP